MHWTFPGVLENNVFRSDPVTNSDEIGQFFYLSLQSDVNTSFFCDDLWRSTNGGQSWTLLSGERGAGGGDKQWFTIDKTNGPGHGFQYQSDDGINCSGGGVQFQRSTNGGVTWQAPIIFLTRLYTERSMWTPTAISLSAEKGAPFTAFARAMPRSGARHQLLTEAPPSTWVATSVAAESME